VSRLATLTPEELHVLQHALGLDKHGRGQAYRRHFCPDQTGPDTDLCVALVAKRFMVERPVKWVGNLRTFIVTEDGEAACRGQSPPPPKLTRSQRRYREWLHSGWSDGMKFGAWLKALPRLRKEGWVAL
jgi:hypothetical protein